MKTRVFSDFEILGGKFMNKNFKSKLVAGLMTTAMIFSSTAAFAPVHAEGNTAKLEFGEYLLTSNKLTYAPTVGFTFTLSIPDSTNGIVSQNSAAIIKAGVGLNRINLTNDSTNDSTTTTPTNTTTVNFTNKDVLNSKGDALAGNTTDQKFAKKTVGVDFSNVTWTAPGIYRYLITQTGPNDFADSYSVADNDNIKAIDVYVINNGTGYSVDTIVMHSDENAEYESKENKLLSTSTNDSKSARFQNIYNSHELGFNKTIDGNQKNETDEFSYSVKIQNLMPGTTYNYMIQHTSSTTQNVENLSFTTDTTGENQTEKVLTFNLSDGGKFALYGLNNGAGYTVTETNKQGYTLTWNGWGPKATDKDGNFNKDNASVSDTALTGDAEFYLLNTKSGNVPTGIIFAVAPFAVGAVVLAAFIIVKMRRTAKQ